MKEMHRDGWQDKDSVEKVITQAYRYTRRIKLAWDDGKTRNDGNEIDNW